jgi:hypothetical protein
MNERRSQARFPVSIPRRAVGGLLVLASAASAPAQSPTAGAHDISFSISWHDPTVSQPGFAGGPPITEGDVLRPALGVDAFGPLPPPFVLITGGQLRLQRYTSCVGHPGGTPCGVELDALSYGLDHELDGVTPFRVWFAVDAFAQGHPPFFLGPNIQTEGGAIGDLSADMLVDLGLPPGPIPPNTIVAGHVGELDGDGLRSASGYVYRGIGLLEPNPPSTTPLHPGDSIDAFDIGPAPAGGLGIVFFSLDAGFVDPRTGLQNSNSAGFENKSGADVLRVDTSGGGTIQLYAPAQLLGLDFFGMSSDDLDALVLAENGVPGFQPSHHPYDWLPGASAGTESDMLLFSVRVGSAVVGLPDSIFGMPIEPGDLLIPPVTGGASPFPGIFFPAEALGLATTRTDGATYGDDMTAGDIEPGGDPYHDCNGNGRDDAVDIAVGYSSDDNLNGIPDECEPQGLRYCFCASGPCGNDDASAGCKNSTGSGTSLDAIGSTSVTIDDLMLFATDLPLNKNGIFYMGGGTVQLPFGDGQRCVTSGGVGLFRYGVQNSGASGSMSRGPGLAAYSCAHFAGSGCITAGSTWNFQNWYRDPMGPCGSAFNLSNGLAVTFAP